MIVGILVRGSEIALFIQVLGGLRAGMPFRQLPRVISALLVKLWFRLNGREHS